MTLRIYAEKAQEYAALTDEMNRADPQLAAFIAALPPEGAVLDLGCGPGKSAAVMARTGLRVTAIDAVAEMVALAERHEGVQALQARFEDLDAVARYDGIWANFSLLHAPRADLPGHLARIVRALKPGGLFHIAVKSGQGSARDSLGRLYTYYTDAELTGLLETAGLAVQSRASGSDKGLSGEISPWISLAARA